MEVPLVSAPFAVPLIDKLLLMLVLVVIVLFPELLNERLAYDLDVTVCATAALYSMVELLPKVIVGVFVFRIELVVSPEKPVVFPVWNKPLIVAAPVVPNKNAPVEFVVINVPSIVDVPLVPKVIRLVPPFMVEPEATATDFEAASVRAKLFVVNRLPELTLPTLILPVTFAAVTTAPSVAPLAFVLSIQRLL